MKYKTKVYNDVLVQISDFRPTNNAIQETQLMFHLDNEKANFMQQCQLLTNAIHGIKNEMEYTGFIPVFGRCFLSDAMNQREDVEKYLKDTCKCAISYVKQSPLNGSKISLWLQTQSSGNIGDDGLYYYEHNDYRHYRTAMSANPEVDSYTQTLHLLNNLENFLNKRQCCFYSNCVRTWFLVRDIDVNYAGLVKARNELFSQYGLNANTHYIASTGIEGADVNPMVKVMLDTHVIKGIKPEQVKYLYAKENLNSTYEYGVAFERGVYMDYGDRRQVYISGTASIDKHGYIIHVGDVVGQAKRAWENVSALLQEADCTFDDVSQMIVYLRDVADYPQVKDMFDKKFPNIPKQIVLAPVCRPGWLIEMECMAEKAIENSNFRKY
jgi:enamine deaminase RidA (YjgF/YER057c/UK114 family)